MITLSLHFVIGLLLLGLVLFGIVIVLKKFKLQEGFEGTLPTAQPSVQGVPGSTTADPTVSKAQDKDIQAMSEALDTFYTLLAKTPHLDFTNLSDDAKAKINAVLDTDYSVEPTVKFVSDATNAITGATAELRQATITLKDGDAPSGYIEHMSQPANRAKEKSRIINQITAILDNAKDKSLKGRPYNDNVLYGKIKDELNKIEDPSTEYLLSFSAAVTESIKRAISSSSEEEPPSEETPTPLNEDTTIQDPFAESEPPVWISQPPVQTRTSIPSAAYLSDLQQRINAEIVSLQSLRSTSPTVTGKINILTQMSADIGDLLSKLERGLITLEEIPIKKEVADSFMANLSGSPGIPELFEPKGMPTEMTLPEGGAPIDTNSSIPDTGAFSDLLSKAKYLKWNLDVKMEYNPELALRDKMLTRLEAIEKVMTEASISNSGSMTPETKEIYLNELREISNTLKQSNSSQGVANRTDRLHSLQTRSSNGIATFSTPEVPDNETLHTAQYGGGIETFPRGEISEDVNSRPGFLMNNDTIRSRGSASAFDESVVGGADYKQRVKELCRQIRSADIGDPESFGCIENQDSVSSSYSWKGNYTMVCNRLGDTWGSWYPEMFGCPKTNPQSKFSAGFK